MNFTNYILLVIILIPNMQTRKFTCDGTFPNFEMKHFEESDNEYIAAINNPKNAAAVVSLKNLNKYIEDFAKQNKLNEFMSTVDKNTVMGAYVIESDENFTGVHFENKDSLKLKQLTEGLELASEIENSFYVVPDYLGTVDITTYMETLFGLRKLDQSWNQFYGIGGNGVHHVMMFDTGTDTLANAINNFTPGMPLSHRMRTIQNLAKFLSQYNEKEKFMLNMNPYNINIKNKSPLDFMEPRIDSIPYVLYLNKAPMFMRVWNFSESQNTNESTININDPQTYNIRQEYIPPDAKDNNCWDKWDSYSLALTGLDIEFASQGFGMLSTILLGIKTKDASNFTDKNNDFLDLIFGDFKSNVIAYMNEVFNGLDPNVDNVTKENFLELPGNRAFHFVLAGVNLYFHSQNYVNYQNELVNSMVQGVNEETTEVNEIVQIIAANDIAKGIESNGLYVEYLVSVLTLRESFRPTAQDMYDSINKLIVELKTNEMDCLDELVTTGKSTKDDYKSLLGKVPVVPDVPSLSDMPTGPSLVVLDFNNRNRRILLI